MLITVKLKYLRIAPRKVRLVADLIRGKKLEEAQAILNFTIKKASDPLLKLLKQAGANAKNNFQIEPSNLFISKIMVNEGPKYKKWEPRARGQAYEIQEKTSHIEIIFDEIVKKTEKKRGLPVKAQAKGAKEDSFFSASAEALAVKEDKFSFPPSVVKEDKSSFPPSAVKEALKPEAEEKISKPEKMKIRPEKEMAKPRTVKGLRKIFQRKVF